MDKTKVRQLSSEAVAELKEFAEKHGLEVSEAGASFGMTDCILKIRLAEKNGSPKTDENNLILSKMLGFEKNIVGEKFIHKASEHKITRIDIKKIKYPIITQNQNGTSYKWDTDTVRRLLKL